MHVRRLPVLTVTLLTVLLPESFPAGLPTGVRSPSRCLAEDCTPRLTIDTPVSPPVWALLQRELLKASADACVEFHERYFDERGFLKCVERWGGDDGPDDAIENCLHWPILHALGADDRVLDRYRRAWEGHLRQYTLARTAEVPFAREGMYYKEFPVMFDWLHHSEGLTVFCHQGLSDPGNLDLARRAGLPPDCAALVESLTADVVTVRLVNTSQLAARTLTVQAGGYAEHEFTAARIGGEDLPVRGRSLTLTLAPGCGTTLRLSMRRFSQPPTMAFPWDRPGNPQ